MKLPPLQYADNGGIAIGYRTAGAGPDVVYTTGASVSMDGSWNWVAPIAEFARVTIYDKRGIGVSDGAANFSFEERMDDIRAVMDAAGIERAHLAGTSEGGPLSVLFAATYPDRVRSLTLYGTYPSWMKRRDYPAGKDMSVSEYSRWVDRIVSALSGVRADMEWFWDMWAPRLAATPGFLEFAAEIKPTCSPRAQRLIWEAMYDADIRSLLPAIHVPTTIAHRRGDRVAHCQGLGRRIRVRVRRRRRTHAQRRRRHLAALPAGPTNALQGVDNRCARAGCVIRFIRVEFHRSASKHGVDNDDAVHAVVNALVVADMGDDESPLRTLVHGPDRSGNMLEVIVLHFDDGREMVIHAMSMRTQYRGLLPRPPETRP